MLYRRVVHLGSTDPETTKNNGGSKRIRRRRKRNVVSSCGFSARSLVQTIRFLILAVAFVLAFYALKEVFYFFWGSHSLRELPWNPIYRIPEASSWVGDRSDRYAKLRKEVDEYFADPELLSEQISEALGRNHDFHPRPMHGSNITETYDIYNCPDEPPDGYPFAWKTLDILKDWPADETRTPDSIYQSFCVFDYTKDYHKALTYRNAALPFVVVNDPAVLKTVARWSLPNYLQRLLGKVKHRTEYSTNNHFMFALPPELRKKENKATPKDWKMPTKLMHMAYANWLRHANVTEDASNPTDPHWYYRLVGCGAMGNDGSCDDGSSEYLYDEAPYFQPRREQLYIVDPKKQVGLHCRFGMRGIISENHFDPGRNAIVVLGGKRRYILSHPDQCDRFALYPRGHPSARHSEVDWSNPDLDNFPQFGKALSSEVVLQAGDVLYLPSNWFHFIVSLDVNFQCNTRSGFDKESTSSIEACGF